MRNKKKRAKKKHENRMVICNHAHECENMEREYAGCWHSMGHHPSHENEGWGSGLDCDEEESMCSFLRKKVKCKKV